MTDSTSPSTYWQRLSHRGVSKVAAAVVATAASSFAGLVIAHNQLGNEGNLVPNKDLAIARYATVQLSDMASQPDIWKASQFNSRNPVVQFAIHECKKQDADQHEQRTAKFTACIFGKAMDFSDAVLKPMEMRSAQNSEFQLNAAGFGAGAGLLGSAAAWLMLARRRRQPAPSAGA